MIGRVFDLELLESMLDLDEGPLLDHLEAAVAASLLAESDERVGQFRFAHALINQTLYEGLGATRRARMHQRVAQALEELYGEDPGEHLAELALHWRLAAVSVDRAKAADYALWAGQRALESLAPAEAVKLFADAVELIGDVDSAERCEALIGLGEAQLQSGEAAYRETLLEASRIASALADAELAARAALANSRGRGLERSATSTQSGSRRSSGRSSSTTRRMPRAARDCSRSRRWSSSGTPTSASSLARRGGDRAGSCEGGHQDAGRSPPARLGADRDRRRWPGARLSPRSSSAGRRGARSRIRMLRPT